MIGETAEIGDRVTLYQGVTLGGTGFARGKRHPTVEDDVTIGSGAKLLGPVTVGHGAKVGANTVVIEDVPAELDRGRQPGPPGAGRGPQGRGPRRRLDPPARTRSPTRSRRSRERIGELEQRLAELDGKAAEGEVQRAAPEARARPRPAAEPSSAPTRRGASYRSAAVSRRRRRH